MLCIFYEKQKQHIKKEKNTEIKHTEIRWELENSGIERQHLDSWYDFKQSNEHMRQNSCAV